MHRSQLTDYLGKIQSVYDIQALAAEKIDARKIEKYYTDVYPAYKFFHSMKDCVHLAINYDGKFNEDGFYEPLRLVQKQVQPANPRNILELASGKGFNSTYLATQMPEVNFTGIDRTPLHVSVAAAKARSMRLTNARFMQGDFHRLSFSDQSFDGVFVVESTCYALDMKSVLEEVYRVLRPGKSFMLIDMFKRKDLDEVSVEERTAARLIEKSMAIDDVLTWDTFINLAKTVGFHIERTQDLTNAVLPNLRRFENLSKVYFRYIGIARLLKKVLPAYFLQSVIAGLLMPTIIEHGVEGYFLASMVRT